MATYYFTPADTEPLLEGLAILGTGGGGPPAWGRAIMDNEFAHRRRPCIVSPEDISDTATVVSGGIMGSVKAIESRGYDEIVNRWEDRFELLDVTRVMEGLLGRRIDHVVPFEVGGLNTPVILSLGARLGIPILDADALGRSAPETQMTSFIGHGVSLTPMPLVDFYGNVVVVKDAADLTFPDQLGRYIVTHGGGLGANNHYPMTGRQAKQAVIPNTISGALGLGKTVLEARRRGTDPVAAVAGTLHGVILHAGEITALAEEERMGFYFTTASLAGRDVFSGSSARLVIKNETMMLSVDGRATVYFPDLVLLLDPETGRGIMSVELKVGTRVALVGVPCHPRLREAVQTEHGRKAFSPARYGRENEQYRAVEELVPALRKPNG